MSILLSQSNITSHPHIIHSIREEEPLMGDHHSLEAEGELIKQVDASSHLSHQNILHVCLLLGYILLVECQGWNFGGRRSRVIDKSTLQNGVIVRGQY